MPDKPTFPADNPYQSPRGDEQGQAPTASDLSGTVDIMRQTRPWVLLLGILGLVGAGLMLVGFLVAALYAAPGGVSFGITELLVVMLIGLMYTVPSILMIRYANCITYFLREQNVDRLNTALTAQRAFWRLIGILAVVIMAIYATVILLAVVGGVAASL